MAERWEIRAGKPGRKGAYPAAICANCKREVIMKNSMWIGAVLGVVTATAIYSASNQNLVKKTKKALLHKL